MNIFSMSFKELGKTRNLALMGLLVALSMVLSSLTLPIGGFLKINFGFLTYGVVGYLFGPVCGMIVAGVTDILSYFSTPNPTGQPLMPVFTLIEMLTGFLMGLFLYRKKINLFNTFLAKGSVNLFSNIIFNTISLGIFVNPVYFEREMVLTRVVKNIALLPLEIILLIALLKSVESVVKKW